MLGPDSRLDLKKLLVIGVLGFLAGAVWYRYRLPPIPQLQYFRDHVLNEPPPEPDIPEDFLKTVVTQYRHRLPVYSDRRYSDTVGDPQLDGKLLVQIPRHHDRDVVIETREPVTVYRMLSTANDNSPFADWEETPISVHIEGITCVFEKVVKKRFEPGRITLPPGGPTAASPILVEVHGSGGPDYGFTVVE